MGPENEATVTQHLEDTLRDRFVCGLRHETIQRRLLSEKDLTYTKAMEIARAMEAADANAKSFKDAGPAIHKFSSQPTRDRDARNPCYRCGCTSCTHTLRLQI